MVQVRHGVGMTAKHSEMPARAGFVAIALSRPVVLKALQVALVVGTLLALINHGGKILSVTLTLEDALRILLTFLVPYGVSTWSAVKAIQAMSERDFDER